MSFRLVGIMASRPGASALAAYRAARRRRAAVIAIAALVLAGAIAYWRRDGSGLPVVVVATISAVTLLLVAGGGRDIDRWRRGAEGERRTAEILEQLPPRRWSVWHDLGVPGSRANVDHVVVGRTGVWVIDSKTSRTPVRAGWRSAEVGGRRLDTGPVRWEAEQVASRLERRLEGVLDRAVTVRPIVAVHEPPPLGHPGEGLRRRGVRVGGVRVVPAPELVRRLTRGRRRLDRSERAMVCSALDVAFGPRARR